jgi:hypothetical protein
MLATRQAGLRDQGESQAHIPPEAYLAGSPGYPTEGGRRRRRSRVDELREHGHDALEQEVQHASDIDRYRRGLRPRLRALITATASFLLTSAATTTGATTATVTEGPGASHHRFRSPVLSRSLI